MFPGGLDAVGDRAVGFEVPRGPFGDVRVWTGGTRGTGCWAHVSHGQELLIRAVYLGESLSKRPKGYILGVLTAAHVACGTKALLVFGFRLQGPGQSSFRAK